MLLATDCPFKYLIGHVTRGHLYIIFTYWSTDNQHGCSWFSINVLNSTYGVIIGWVAMNIRTMSTLMVSTISPPSAIFFSHKFKPYLLDGNFALILGLQRRGKHHLCTMQSYNRLNSLKQLAVTFDSKSNAFVWRNYIRRTTKRYVPYKIS